jgi:hypothetical protein
MDTTVTKPPTDTNPDSDANFEEAINDCEFYSFDKKKHSVGEADFYTARETYLAAYRVTHPPVAPTK